MIVSQIIFHDVLLPFKFGGYLLIYKYANYDINRESDKIEKENREKNAKALEEHIKRKYGEVVSKVVEVEYIGRRRGWHADSEYILHFPFANDKTIYVESETQKIFSRDFSFATDPKFQHLYSEWVKKQVGIEDENVEFGFAGNYDTPYIEFNKITSLSDDYREVFENTHNIILLYLIKRNISDLSKENWYDYANIYTNCFDRIKRIVKLNPLCDNNGFLIYLYKNNTDRYDDENKELYYGTINQPYNIDTAIVNGSIYENMAEFELLSNGQVEKYTISKTGDIIEK